MKKKEKSRFNITKIGSFKRQVLISMSLMNSNKFIAMSSIHVANIDRAFEDIKSDTVANFVQADQRGLTITTNKVAFISDLNTINR